MLFLVGNISYEDILFANRQMANCVLEESINISKSQDFRKTFGHRKPSIHFENAGWDYLDVNISFDVDTNKIACEELNLFNAILGGGIGSLLQMEIREKTGISSNIYSLIEEYCDVSVLHIVFSTDRKQLYNSIQLIMNVLNCVKKEIDDIQIESNMPYFTENLWFRLEEIESYNLHLAFERFIRGKEKKSIEDEINLYSEVTKQRLVQVANAILKKENMTVTVLGSKGRLTNKEILRIIEQALEGEAQRDYCVNDQA
jgi:hypothetical protein